MMNENHIPESRAIGSQMRGIMGKVRPLYILLMVIWLAGFTLLCRYQLLKNFSDYIVQYIISLVIQASITLSQYQRFLKIVSPKYRKLSIEYRRAISEEAIKYQEIYKEYSAVKKDPVLDKLVYFLNEVMSDVLKDPLYIQACVSSRRGPIFLKLSFVPLIIWSFSFHLPYFNWLWVVVIFCLVMSINIEGKFFFWTSLYRSLRLICILILPSLIGFLLFQRFSIWPYWGIFIGSAITILLFYLGSRNSKSRYILKSEFQTFHYKNFTLQVNKFGDCLARVPIARCVWVDLLVKNEETYILLKKNLASASFPDYDTALMFDELSLEDRKPFLHIYFDGWNKEQGLNQDDEGSKKFLDSLLAFIYIKFLENEEPVEIFKEERKLVIDYHRESWEVIIRTDRADIKYSDKKRVDDFTFLYLELESQDFESIYSKIQDILYRNDC